MVVKAFTRHHVVRRKLINHSTGRPPHRTGDAIAAWIGRESIALAGAKARRHEGARRRLLSAGLHRRPELLDGDPLRRWLYGEAQHGMNHRRRLLGAVASTAVAVGVVRSQRI